jgi:hypothetical protein
MIMNNAPTESTSMADPAKLAYCGRKPGTKPSKKQQGYPEWLVIGSTDLGGLYSGQEPIENGVLITKSATDTDWFHTLAKTANAVCLIRGRLKLTGNSPTLGSALFYYGNDFDGFIAVFGNRGLVYSLQPFEGADHE